MGKFLDKLLDRNAFDFEGNAEKLLRNDSLRFSFPVDLANPLMDYMLERSYLEDVSKITEFKDYSFNNRSSTGVPAEDRELRSSLSLAGCTLISSCLESKNYLYIETIPRVNRIVYRHIG